MMHRWRYERRATELPCPPQVHYPLGPSTCLAIQKLFKLFIWGFMETVAWAQMKHGKPCWSVIGPKGFNLMLRNWVGRPNKVPVYEYFLVSICNNPPSGLWGRNSLKWGGFYDLHLKMNRPKNFFTVCSKRKGRVLEFLWPALGNRISGFQGLPLRGSYEPGTMSKTQNTFSTIL